MYESQHPSISIVVPIYNPGDQEIFAIHRLVSELIGYEDYFELVIVNDSHEPLPKGYIDFATRFSCLQIVDNMQNMGRGSSLNNGASAANAPILWFLDADCLVPGDTLEQAILLNWDDWDVHFGVVENRAKHSFWSQYQQQRRDANSFTSTANVLIRKSLFDQMGGFDSSYTRYGFEDRDLVERFHSEVRVTHNQSLVVEHHGEVSLGITRNKIESAGISGRRFASKFPEAYLETEYAKVDAATINPVSYATLALLEAFERLLFPVSKYLVDQSGISFILKKNIVRFTFACAYFRGTRSVGRQ